MPITVNSISELIKLAAPSTEADSTDYFAGLKIIAKVFGEDFIDFPLINFDTERFIDNGRTVTIPFYHSSQVLSINNRIDLLVVCDTGNGSVDCPYRISFIVDRKATNFDIRIHDQSVTKSYSIISKDGDDYFTELGIEIGSPIKLSQLITKVESLR